MMKAVNQFAVPVCTNRKARFEYELLSKYTAGLVLKGTEVKPIRNGKCNISSAYISFINGKPVIYGMQIESTGLNSKRTRSLLLKKREISKLIGQNEQKGLTLVPLHIFISQTGFIKIEFAVGKGKKEYDKRAAIKKRELERESCVFMKKA